MKVAEHFYSIQGEMSTMGIPSVFLRMTGCNLECGGVNTIKDKQLHNATWRCDSIEVWLKGKEYDKYGLVKLFVEKGYVDRMIMGAHLIITGGEPMSYQKDIADFLRQLNLYYQDNFSSLVGPPYIEIETNGTLEIEEEFDTFVNQYNVSPKLSNSGMPKQRRIRHEAFMSYVKNEKAEFKFVVNTAKDVEEVIIDYLDEFDIDASRVWLMPACDTRQKLNDSVTEVAELCKEHGFKFSSRLQIEIWDKCVGV